MHALLFEEPIQLGIVVVIVIAIQFGVHNRFRTPRTLGVLLAGLVLGPALFIVQHLVVTDREQIEANTRELAARVEAGDLDAIYALCANDAVFSERGYFESQLERLLTRYEVTEARAGGFAVTLDGDSATVRCGATCTVRGGHATGQTVPSRWELTYHKNGDQWLLSGIRPLMIAGQKMDRLGDIP